jgi:hypothetical protein
MTDLDTWILVEPEKQCLSQRIFYKLRSGLVETFRLKRRDITLNTVLTDIIPYDQLQDGWPYLGMCMRMRTPNFEVAIDFLGFRLSSRTLTIKELVESLMKLNTKFLAPDDSPKINDVYRRVKKVVVAQLNVNPEEVTMDASFTKDLGAD